MADWSGYTIAAVVLVILGIIMLIAGIAWMEWDSGTTANTPTSWWPWFLIIGGILFLLIGIVVGFLGRSYSKTTTSTYSETHHSRLPGADPYIEGFHHGHHYAITQATSAAVGAPMVGGGPPGYPATM